MRRLNYAQALVKADACSVLLGVRKNKPKKVQHTRYVHWLTIIWSLHSPRCGLGWCGHGVRGGWDEGYVGIYLKQVILPHTSQLIGFGWDTCEEGTVSQSSFRFNHRTL